MVHVEIDSCHLLGDGPAGRIFIMALIFPRLCWNISSFQTAAHIAVYLLYTVDGYDPPMVQLM